MSLIKRGDFSYKATVSQQSIDFILLSIYQLADSSADYTCRGVYAVASLDYNSGKGVRMSGIVGKSDVLAQKFSPARLTPRLFA